MLYSFNSLCSPENQPCQLRQRYQRGYCIATQTEAQAAYICIYPSLYILDKSRCLAQCVAWFDTLPKKSNGAIRNQDLSRGCAYLFRRGILQDSSLVEALRHQVNPPAPLRLLQHMVHGFPASVWIRKEVAPRCQRYVQRL